MVSFLVTINHISNHLKQVPSRNSSSYADTFLKNFLSEIPIFKLLGTPKLVKSTAQYSDVSDPDVQLVCKYLRAYEIGGKKGIDKLYKGAAPSVNMVQKYCGYR